MDRKQLLPKTNDPLETLQIEGKNLRRITAKKLRKEFEKELLKRTEMNSKRLIFRKY